MDPIISKLYPSFQSTQINAKINKTKVFPIKQLVLLYHYMPLSFKILNFAIS